MAEQKRRRLPAWLVGLVIAALISLATLLLLSALGYGDDPVVDSVAAILG